jgi:carbonic anhydrase
LLKEPALKRWLEHARPAQQRIAKQALAADQRHRAMVEENARLQLEHAQTYSCVREAMQQNRLDLHGWVYDIFTGHVAELKPRQ